MNFFNESLNDVYKELETSIDGLSKKERKKRLEKYGANKIESEKKESKWVKFFKQFKDLMIIILLFAAAFSFVEALRGYPPNHIPRRARETLAFA